MIPPQTVLRWEQTVKSININSIKPTLVLAMVWQESSGDTWATRYEETWRYFVHKGQPLYDKTKSVINNRITALKTLGHLEFHQQSMSYGLMQIVGSTAREIGFPYRLSALYEPYLNIDYACRYLSRHLKATKTVGEALKNYNGTGVAATRYAREVLEKESAIIKQNVM